jgi:hypothetical protein
MPMGAGMAGACAAGTCSGGVAAGGCGGPGGCGNSGACVSRPLSLCCLREVTDFYRVVEAPLEAAEAHVAGEEGAVEEVEVDAEAVVDSIQFRSYQWIARGEITNAMIPMFSLLGCFDVFLREFL